MTKKPQLLYRLSKDRKVLYLRVPDESEGDTVLIFNRVMADFGYTPKSIWDKSLGVAVVPAIQRITIETAIVKIDLFEELKEHFLMTPIPDRDWYKKRF